MTRRDEFLKAIREQSPTQALEQLERDGQVKRAAEFIKLAMDDQSFTPLATRANLEQLIKRSNSVQAVFETMFKLIGREDFGPVPSRDKFIIVADSYTGVDGDIRHPLPKYIPHHIAPLFKNLQSAYWEFMVSSGKPIRPGLIVQSGYRSPAYQMGILTRAIATQGLTRALTGVMLPGASQHGDYEHCAIDLTNIGDAEGKTVGLDRKPIPFETTQEFVWLLDNIARLSFWLPYFPNPKNISGALDRHGVLVEPWHIQFLPDATERMEKHNVKELFLERIAHRI